MTSNSRDVPLPAVTPDDEHARLATWEDRLTHWEALLSQRERDLAAPVGGHPRWALPAEPVADALHHLRTTPGMRDVETEQFASGLGLEPAWVEAVLTGAVTEANVEQIAAVCESLHCSPYDLWPPALAGTILHTYGPEQWPRHLEPLDTERPTDDNLFVARRLDQQVAEMVTVQGLEPASRPGSEGSTQAPTTVLATWYRQRGIIAVDAGGTATLETDPSAPADPGAEYHLVFAQVQAPRYIALPVGSKRFAAGPGGGYDADPVLVGAATTLAGVTNNAGADLVRFTGAATGHEWWLGRDASGNSADTGGTWHTWDDPRDYYPGPEPSDVLDPAGFPAPDAQLTLPVDPTALTPLMSREVGWPDVLECATWQTGSPGRPEWLVAALDRNGPAPELGMGIDL